MTKQLINIPEENIVSDELINRAVALIDNEAVSIVSVSSLQRRLSLNYSCASQLYQALDKQGHLVPEIQPKMFRNSLVSALIVALAADFLFWHHPVGWTASLFGVSLAGLTIFFYRDSLCSGVRRIAGPIIVLLVAVISCTLHRSILGIILGLAGLAGVAIAVQPDRFLSLVQWITELAKFVGYAAVLSLYEIGNHLKRQKFFNPKLINQVKIWLIAICLAAGFLALFAMANPVLEEWLKILRSKIAALDLHLDFSIIPRAGLFLVFGLFVWALMGYRCSVIAGDGDVKEPPTLPVSFTDVCLILFNLVFAVQSVLDIGYLFSGVQLPEEFTYAEYAHRGFYPLWVASMLAGGFMLLFWSDDPKKYPPSKLRNTLLFIWIGQNVLLLFSTIYRMHLYVCVYSLTFLRVAALSGMVLVLAGLASITVRIVRRKNIGWLLNVNGCAVIAVLLLLAVANVSSRVAWFNVKHCKESSGSGSNLDVRYLYKLGVETLPALVHFVEKHPDAPRIEYAQDVIGYMRKEFESGMGNWRGWTISRYKISKVIANLPKQAVASSHAPAFDRSKASLSHAGWGG